MRPNITLSGRIPCPTCKSYENEKEGDWRRYWREGEWILDLRCRKCGSVFSYVKKAGEDKIPHKGYNPYGIFSRGISKFKRFPIIAK